MIEIPLSVSYFAVRKIGTDLFFPRLDTGRGGTWAEPTHWTKTPPRLFNSEVAAKLCLRAWLKGQLTQVHSRTGSIFGEDDNVELVYRPVKSRRLKDFEIVRVKLVVEELVHA